MLGCHQVINRNREKKRRPGSSLEEPPQNLETEQKSRSQQETGKEQPMRSEKGKTQNVYSSIGKLLSYPDHRCVWAG